MMRRFFFSLIFFLPFFIFSQKGNPHYLNNQTYNYEELIAEYKSLELNSSSARLLEVGFSDVGKPIHLFVIDKHREFSADKARQRKKAIVFINNGIHAGDACGIDASVELAKGLLGSKSNKLLDSVLIVIVPIYNVGGMLNRGAYSRANQNGPQEHGFRGNARNLDLNRDFIKCDSRNAKTFTRTFREWDPDIFIDTHTTNGSDHSYTLTLIATQKDKLNPVLSAYAEEKMITSFYSAMKKQKMEMIPYIYSMAKTPDYGIKAFMETPRYSSGYASLFDCFSFITEAHVFKSFKERVIHTKAFLWNVIDFAASNAAAIRNKRKEAKKYTKQQAQFPIKWKLDTSKLVQLKFKGYETENRESEVTNQKMTFYNAAKPYQKDINYYNSYIPEITVKKPSFYIVPQSYPQVIERLKLNKVELKKIKRDTIVELEVYYITNYKTSPQAYEAHYLHSDVELTKKKETLTLYKGDYMVLTQQRTNRYIVETLEPQSVDGFFAWNFFDGILQQKEWFSDYAFEPKAKELLEKDGLLRNEFEEKKKSDEAFAKNNFAQLYFIYKRSPYYEKTVNQFPIYRSIP